ncbi:AAA family ATPase [Amycolatopsis sp. NPDC059090]|uniref:AAA family ATPase n=1 Tax=unclassified Amycolatopsis TaxID=2618356 RepID=UPI00366CF216
MSPVLIATVGPPGAGKTTWRREHASEEATVVSLDEIRARLSACGCSADPAANAAAVEAGTALTRETLAAGGTVVWDTTGYLRRFRTHLLDLAEAHRARTVAIVLLPPLLTVLERNGRRDGARCPVCGHARRVPDQFVWSAHRAIADALPRLHAEGWDTVEFLALPPYLRDR